MPGSKNMSSSSGNPAVASRPPKPFESEGQFILRLPEPVAELVRLALANPKDVLKDRLKIDMSPDDRLAKVYVDSMEFSAKLVDLPCIVESHKTIDRKTFYKTGDICQMLVVSDKEVSPEDVKEAKSDARPDEINKDKKYQWNHGLTPPLKNVRKTRFRKTLKRKDAELQEIESELKRLLRADSEAVNVRWEISTEDETATPTPRNPQNRSQSESLDMDSTMQSDVGTSSRNRMRGTAETDIFGGVVSSSSDEEDETTPVDMSEENNFALGFLD